MGMARKDFEGCTPGEFYAIHHQWSEREQWRDRGEWERARILALCILQPHSSKALDPEEVLPLPWDKTNTPIPEPTREERKERYQSALKRYGMSRENNP